jgi:hypothetical protein
MDEKLGRKRPASAAFENTTGTLDMSVELQKLLSNPMEAKRNYPTYSLARFPIQMAKDLNQEIKHTPNTESAAHCDVVGAKNEKTKKKFARESELFHIAE